MERAERGKVRSRVMVRVVIGRKVHRQTRGVEVLKVEELLEGIARNQRTRMRSVRAIIVSGKIETYVLEGKIATAEDAARVDADPPLDQLMRLLKEKAPKVENGESVVYWMRMNDMRRTLTQPLGTSKLTSSRGQYCIIKSLKACQRTITTPCHPLCPLAGGLQMARQEFEAYRLYAS
jgi:hypothetical protein